MNKDEEIERIEGLVAYVTDPELLNELYIELDELSEGIEDVYKE